MSKHGISLPKHAEELIYQRFKDAMFDCEAKQEGIPCARESSRGSRLGLGMALVMFSRILTCRSRRRCSRRHGSPSLSAMPFRVGPQRTGRQVAKFATHINVQLDERHAAKLHQLAERTHVKPETLASSLLSAALEGAVPDPSSVVEVLDAIPGAFERAQRSLREVRSGQGKPLAGI